MLRILDERLFFIIFIYLNKHKNFHSRIEQSLKFILIYNLYFYFYFLFLFTSSIALIDARSWLLFSMKFIYFRSSTILVESPSTTELNNFFSLFCTTSSRRLSVLDYGEFPNVSKNCICCIVGSRGLKSSHGDIAMWNISKNPKWMKKMNFSMNYYLNVSLIGSSTKNDRCQDVTRDRINYFKNWFYH